MAKTEFSKVFLLLPFGYSDLAGCSKRIKQSSLPKYLLIDFNFLQYYSMSRLQFKIIRHMTLSKLH